MHEGRIQRIALYGALLMVGFGAGLWYATGSNGGGESDAPGPIRAVGPYRFTNPLLECDLGSRLISKNSIRPFKPAVDQYIAGALAAGRASDISVYFRDLNDGPWFGINEKELFFPASLLKVPLMMSLLKMAEDDPGILTQTILYQKPYVETDQYIKPQDPIVVGKTYRVNELLDRMIRGSDNNAAFILSELVGLDRENEVYRELGVPLPEDRVIDFLSAKSYASFFRILFNSSYLGREMSERALTLLSGTEFSQGLVSGVPPQVTVSHKFGEIVNDSLKQLHDCGIVYYPNKPYLLCVMTRGDDYATLAGVIKDVSALAFREVDAQSKPR